MPTPEDGLKILARMIAEAYLEELSQKLGQENSRKNKEEQGSVNRDRPTGLRKRAPYLRPMDRSCISQGFEKSKIDEGGTKDAN